MKVLQVNCVYKKGSTFCWAVANDEEFHVNDRSTELELLYIDDLVEISDFPSQRGSKPFSGDNRNILFCIFH